MPVVINNAKLKEVAYSSFPQDASSGSLGGLFQEAFDRLERLREEPGCNCKKGGRRKEIYLDIAGRLASAEDIQPLKDFLGTSEVVISVGTEQIER
jgi:hypothetical protein|tara:strand:- start:8 stop:295 length:288 start_codon:yes stop_codon:yes gene_type:complete